MSFLSGLFLLAIPLALVPVLLHFYQRRQRDVIHWGAMQFLMDDALRGRRIERIEEWLLMILRTAILMLLIFALARPLVRSQWLGDAPAREVVILLDNSMSTERTLGDSTVFDGLRERAQKVIDELGAQDRVQVALAAAGPDWLTAEPVAATENVKAELIARLQETTPSRGSADWFDCLQSISTFSTAASTDHDVKSRRVILLTDDQAHGWHADLDSAWQRLLTAFEDSAIPTTIEVVLSDAEESNIANLAITRLTTPRTLVAPGDTVRVTAEITNVGDSKSEATTIEWLADEERLGESAVPPLAPGSGASVTWIYRAESVGFTLVSGRLALGDAIASDDIESLVVECTEQIPILIARQEADYGKQFSDTRFFTAALGFRDDGSPHEAWQSVYVPHGIDTGALATAALNDYRVVVITNLPKLPPAVIDRLTDYVQDGGGLWIVLGSQTDRVAFNSTIFNDGAGFCPLPLVSLVDVGERKESAIGEVAGASVITVHPPSGEHPATVNLADTERLDIEEVQISRYFRFAQKQPDQDVAVLLETSFGEPLVIENYFRQGRVIIQAVPLGVGWTNWPLTKSYVVMVHDWLTHLAQSGATKNNLRPGGPILVDRDANSAVVDAEIQTPQGAVVPLVAQDHDGSRRFRFTHTRTPGVYQVMLQQGSEPVARVPFHVARDVKESDLSPLAPEVRTRLAAASVLSFQTKVGTQAATTLDVPSYRPIWPLLLIALLALMALEALLASRFARQRYAPVPMTS